MADRNDARVPLFDEGEHRWTKWLTVMKRLKGKDPDFVKRERVGDKNPVGFRIINKKLESLTGGKDNGIYEFKMVDKGGFGRVVYVGKSSSASKTSLCGRIKDYLANGSHKGTEINEALVDRYDLQVRVMSCSGEGEEADDLEDEILDKYDYDWNIVGNQ